MRRRARDHREDTAAVVSWALVAVAWVGDEAVRDIPQAWRTVGECEGGGSWQYGSVFQEDKVMTCPRCHGLLHRDDDGLLWCWACSRVANAPPLMPVDLWRGGPQPAPLERKERSGNHGPRKPVPPYPVREDDTSWASITKKAQATYREQLRRIVVGKATGKQSVAGSGGSD